MAAEAADSVDSTAAAVEMWRVPQDQVDFSPGLRGPQGEAPRDHARIRRPHGGDPPHEEGVAGVCKGNSNGAFKFESLFL